MSKLVISETDLDGLLRAAVKLRDAEAELGKKLIPYAVGGANLMEQLSIRIGIKAPLLKELASVALGFRRRHGKALTQFEELKKAG